MCTVNLNTLVGIEFSEDTEKSLVPVFLMGTSSFKFILV